MPAQTLLDIQSRARANPKRIALCDAFDERMLRAARDAMDNGIAEIVLVGDPDIIARAAETSQVSLAGVEIISPQTDLSDRTDIPELYYQSRKHKLASRDEAQEEILANELLFAALLA